MTIPTSGPPARRLPVNQTFTRAYQLTWQNRLRLARAGIVPFLLLTAAFTLYFQIFKTVQPTDKSFSDVFSRIPASRMLSAWLTGFLGMMTLLSLNVTWRRFLLGMTDTVDSSWFRKPFWKYGLSVFLGCLVFIFLLSVIGSITTQLLQKVVANSPALVVPMLMTVAGLLVLFVWHLPLFTEVMTNEPHLDISRYRAVMKGNIWRVMGVWLLTFCTISFGDQLLTAPLRLIHDPTGTIGLVILQAVMLAAVMILCTVVGSAVSALVYDFTIRGSTPGK